LVIRSSAERLVHQQQPRLRKERAAERNALAFTARQRAGGAIEQRCDAEQLHHVVEPDLRSRRFQRAAVPVEKVSADRQVCKQAGFLKDISDRPLIRLAELAARIVLPHVAADGEAAAQAIESRHAAQDGGLPAPGGSEQGSDPAHRRLERDVELEAAQHALISHIDRRLRAAHVRAAPC
jgi:hypothetical protein